MLAFARTLFIVAAVSTWPTVNAGMLVHAIGYASVVDDGAVEVLSTQVFAATHTARATTLLVIPKAGTEIVSEDVPAPEMLLIVIPLTALK